MAAQGNSPAGLVLVYASVRYDLGDLLAGVRSITGSAPLAGFTSCGHFTDEHIAEPGTGVTVLVLSGGDYRFGVASAVGMGTAPEEVGVSLARAAKAAVRRPDGSTDARSGTHPYAAMLLFTDGLGGDQQAVLSGVYRVCGAAVPVVGGAAGDDRLMTRTHVFHDGRVLTDAAVGVWISSPRPLTVSSAHGWVPISLPVLITRSEGLTVHEIGGRPAGEIFLELASTVGEPRTMPDGRNWLASFALGLIEPDGSHLIRGAFPTLDGTINTFTPLPAYSAVQVMTADVDGLLSVIDPVVEASLKYGDESVLLAFDCIARMDIMGPDYPDEVAGITKAARGIRCFGTYTYGEFARVRGIGGVHNATLTTLAL
jgi:hypothetical protein